MPARVHGSRCWFITMMNNANMPMVPRAGCGTTVGTFSQALLDEAKSRSWTVISMKNDRSASSHLNRLPRSYLPGCATSGSRWQQPTCPRARPENNRSGPPRAETWWPPTKQLCHLPVDAMLPPTQEDVHAAAVASGRVHAWRYQPRRDVPCTRSAGARGVGSVVPGGDGQSGSEWTPAQWHGRRHLVAVEDLRAGTLGAGGCRYRLHLCAGPNQGAARRLPQQLRQHVPAVGPFAVDEGLVRPNGDTAVVRIFNTNTRKIIRSTFPLEMGARPRMATGVPGRCRHGRAGAAGFPGAWRGNDGQAATDRECSRSPGCAGSGPIEVSLVDAANACVFVRARDLGLTGRNCRKLGARSGAAGTDAGDPAAGLDRDGDCQGRRGGARPPRVPIIGFVAPPMDAPTLSGEPIGAAQVDLTARFLSNGQPHRALPLTGLALHRGRGRDHRHGGGGGAGSRGRRAGADRDAERDLVVGAEVSRNDAGRGSRIAGHSTGPRGGCSMAGSTCLAEGRWPRASSTEGA